MDALGEFLNAIPYDQLLIQTVNGIVTGMILALIASGLTLIFGIMDVVNFAHGELFMFGAYMGVVVLAATGSFWLALILAALIVALIGAALQITTLRPLIGRDPLTTILATFGISLVMQNYALWQFGPVARKINEPFTGQFTLFYLRISLVPDTDRGAVGRHHRRLLAVPEIRHLRHLDPRHHPGPGDGEAMGIPVPWVHTAVFAIGAAMAAASGVLFGPLVGVNHAMGLDWVLKAFIVVVVGGMGNLGGSIAASIFISLLEAYASIWVSPSQAVIVSFVVLILTLLFRPTGLFVPTPK